jgi:hypothetical protein
LKLRRRRETSYHSVQIFVFKVTPLKTGGYVTRFAQVRNSYCTLEEQSEGRDRFGTVGTDRRSVSVRLVLKVEDERL